MNIIIFGANKVGAMIASQFYTDNDITVIDNEKNKDDAFIICDNTDFVIFASYTAMMDMRHLLIESFGGDEFWQ